MNTDVQAELKRIFDTLARAGGKSLCESERTVKCDVMDTLFRHRPVTQEPFGNIPLYRLLLAFNRAGARVVLNCDNALNETHPDVAAFVQEIKQLGLSDELLRDETGAISIKAWPKPEIKCGVLIDNNLQGHGHRSHVYFHPADGELQDMQAAAGEPDFKIKVPAFMRLAK